MNHKSYDCHGIKWLSNSTLLYHYENYYGAWDHKLVFTIFKDEQTGCFNIEALRDGECFDNVSHSSAFDAWSSDIKPSDGCFFLRTYHGESPLEDELVLAKRIKVTGRIVNTYVEVRPDPEWLASLPVRVTNKKLGQYKMCTYIEHERGRKSRVAKTLHGDFKWTITEVNPDYDAREHCPHCYRITIRNVNDRHMCCGAGADTLVDALLKALNYERAMVELFETGGRVTERFNVSFFKFFENIASHNWYLEG